MHKLATSATVEVKHALKAGGGGGHSGLEPYTRFEVQPVPPHVLETGAVRQGERWGVEERQSLSTGRLISEGRQEN